MANRSSQGLTDEDKLEIHLTLVLDPSNRSRLEDLPLLHDGWQEPQESQLTLTYFDAHGWPLTNSNLSLWVERERRRYRQYLQTTASRVGVAAVCKVQESPIATSRPALSRLADEAVHGPLVSQAVDKLESFCRTKLARTTRHLCLENGCKITAVIDIGELFIGSTKSPFGKLTLRLASGPRDLPFELGLQIAQAVPVRITAESPARNALALLPGQTPKSRKAGTLNLSTDATVDDALAHTAQECLNHILANEACLLESEDPEGVHQMRVGVRRFRSALRTFRTLLLPEQYARLNGELRCIGNRMGAARDWDVFADEIVGPAASGRLEEKAFQALQNRINECRTRSRQAARDAILSQRYTTLLLRLSAWLAKRAWRDQPVSEVSAILLGPVRAFADDRLTDLYKPVRSAGTHFEMLSVSERHQFRIRVKRLRYATEFFGSIYPCKTVKRYRDKLANLQDALGYSNDVAVAAELVRRICAGCTREDLELCRFAGGVIIDWHARALADSEQYLNKRVMAFIEGKPFWLQLS